MIVLLVKRTSRGLNIRRFHAIITKKKTMEISRES